MSCWKIDRGGSRQREPDQHSGFFLTLNGGADFQWAATTGPRINPFSDQSADQCIQYVVPPSSEPYFHQIVDCDRRDQKGISGLGFVTTLGHRYPH